MVLQTSIELQAPLIEVFAGTLSPAKLWVDARTSSTLTDRPLTPYSHQKRTTNHETDLPNPKGTTEGRGTRRSQPHRRAALCHDLSSGRSFHGGLPPQHLPAGGSRRRPLRYHRTEHHRPLPGRFDQERSQEKRRRLAEQYCR